MFVARAQLEAALDFIRAGDVFVVTKLDRLARSVVDLCAIVKRIETKAPHGRLRKRAQRGTANH